MGEGAKFYKIIFKSLFTDSPWARDPHEIQNTVSQIYQYALCDYGVNHVREPLENNTSTGSTTKKSKEILTESKIATDKITNI